MDGWMDGWMEASDERMEICLSYGEWMEWIYIL